MKKTIMLVCAAGMSTSLLVTKMQQAATASALEREIFAVSAMEAEEILADKTVDILMLGPQVRYMLAEFKAKLAPLGIPVVAIPMTDYGMMRGDKVLETAESLIGG
ncbi:lichenan-specific phosphotransferase enzyme iib component (pts system lichenan-specific eiib component) (eiib-lic) [Streptococcus suis]|uniref:Lichenan-specific phosphotransferase enzyme iib component (Pts system lichenan-specific eiib component) (Eiib-lic) n=1 Tax=Streptococcus suis TaxID=1307 RepID=A0A0Z8MNU8_STRSU|nr:lichenan-specific phosphotransferase enzyme iib component (pts system lichenan-specific eiib component) (eiib-lic) [Streptococcus suis]CYW12375.1 lichenan-specific phosphotransferase enzyme iib component (pts system lichenan-specific eiib component) (eiib-lic) [Streptococcus suis]CYX96853.1 lichenan-specific phosphotransferase enzyme iib component (pts system lichenan-specific eiib component) (eiib-lic) [Streptococcus suis]